MGIGSVTSTNSMSVMQMTSANITDSKSKSIQKELTDVQQQMQKLSSDEALSVNEKSNERRELQKEKSALDTELKRHQEELLRSQKRERMLAELREAQDPEKKTDPEGKIQQDENESGRPLPAKETSSDQTDKTDLPAGGLQPDQSGKPGTVIAQTDDGTVILKEALAQKNPAGVGEAKESSDASDEFEKDAAVETETKPAEDDMAADTALSGKEVRAMVSADASAQQANRLGTVVAKTNDGIAILKGEINQDERRGVDTERKQAELEKMEKQEERATAFQFSILGGANNAMKSAAENAAETNDSAQDHADYNAFANAMNVSQEEQQRFYVSIA